MAQVNNKVGYFPTNYVGLLKKAARFVMYYVSRLFF